MSAYFIIDHYRSKKSVYDFVSSQLGPFSPRQRRFFFHVLINNLLNVGKINDANLQGWVSMAVDIPASVITSEFKRGFSWKPLRKSGLIEATGYSSFTHQCRSFAVADKLFQEILELIRRPSVGAASQPVNLCDGTPYSRKETTGLGTAPSAKLVRHAIKCFDSTECPINLLAVQDHLAWKLAQNGVVPSFVEFGWRRIGNYAAFSVASTTAGLSFAS